MKQVIFTKRWTDQLTGAEFSEFCRVYGMTEQDMTACGLTGYETGRARYDAALAIRRALRAGNFSRCLDSFNDEPCANIAEFVERIDLAVAAGC